jgi:hypothetical protein
MRRHPIEAFFLVLRRDARTLSARSEAFVCVPIWKGAFDPFWFFRAKSLEILTGKKQRERAKDQAIRRRIKA